MKKQLTAADFTANQYGIYSSPLTSYTIQDNLYGADCGKTMPSLLLLATEEDTTIDAGLFHSWDDVLAVLNFSRLQDAYTTAAVAVYDNPSTDAAQLTADKATFATLRRELDKLTPLSQFMPAIVATIVKELTAKDVFITVSAERESSGIAYDSLSECMTKRQIKALLEKAETNEWHWCSIAVTAEYMDEECNEYIATTYLGGCSYKSRQDFIKNSGYYDDMLAEVLTDLNSQF